MNSNRVFQITLVISVLTHGVMMFQNTGLNLWRKVNDEKIEVNYVKDTSNPLDYRKEPLKNPDTPPKIPSSRLSAKKTNPPPFAEIKKQDSLSEDKNSELKNPVFEKPAVIKADVISIRKKITIPALDLDKISNPSYLNYYQIVREKIKRAAYQNYSHTETGEVYLSFIISQKGELGQIHLNEEKTRASLRLRDIGLRSVKEASPFPVFPGVLEYPQLSFNVVISFEIE